VEAEQAVLGALLLSETAVVTVVQYLKKDDFYSKANQVIFDAILGLYNRNVKSDMISLRQELLLNGALDIAGGEAYVASLTSVVPTAANIEYYAQLVQDASLKRALLETSYGVSAQVFDESLDGKTVLEETQQKVFQLSETRHTLKYRTVKEVLREAIDIIETRYKTKGAVTGIPSGFDDLDFWTSGFQGSELIVIGARPSVGKTALALTMASFMAVRKKIPTAFFSLEMPGSLLTQRILAGEAIIDSSKIRSGALSPADFSALMDASGRIYEAPLYFVDDPNMKLLDLRSQARRLRLQERVEIIFIDYIGLIETDDIRKERWQQISEISRSLKSLARELRIPIVALSQVNRNAEGKRPTLADIRESGAIEQDADMVLFLQRERELDKKRDEQAEGIPTELIIAKQRNGPVGTVDILYLPRFTKFVPLDKNQ
jgi:replicative DNA helicase